MESFNILITCSSNKTQILEWLNKTKKKFNFKIKLFCGDTNSSVATKFFCDFFWKMPLIKDTNFNKILSYCLKKNIKIIIPTSDQELNFWAKYKKKLQENKIFVMVSEEDTIKKCLDKLAFYKITKNKVKSIFTSNNIVNFKEKKIFVSKKRFGSGSKNLKISKNYSEIFNFTKRDRKNFIFQNYIKFDYELSVDCYFSSKNNKLLKIVARKRKYIINGESVVTSVIRNRKIYDIIKNVSKDLKFSGHIMFQFLVKKKNLYLLECNPRIGGASFISYFNLMDSIYYFIIEQVFPKKSFKVKKEIFAGSKLIIFKKTKYIK